MDFRCVLFVRDRDARVGMDARPRVCGVPGMFAWRLTRLDCSFCRRDEMASLSNRREFLRTTAVAGASLALTRDLLAAPQQSVLVFTKSSGWEHDVVKRMDGKLSIVENAVTELGKKNNFSVVCSKDGRIFDSSEFAGFGAVFFFTTGDLLESGTDKQPPMTAAGKEKLLDAIRDGKGLVGSHAASDTFRTEKNLILTCECSAENSLFMEARRACKPAN